jgi:hypothetical protein
MSKNCYKVREHTRCSAARRKNGKKTPKRGVPRPAGIKKPTRKKAPLKGTIFDAIKKIQAVAPPPVKKAVKAAPPAKPASMQAKSKKKRVSPMLVSGPSSTPRPAFDSKTTEKKKSPKTTKDNFGYTKETLNYLEKGGRMTDKIQKELEAEAKARYDKSGRKWGQDLGSAFVDKISKKYNVDERDFLAATAALAKKFAENDKSRKKSLMY